MFEIRAYIAAHDGDKDLVLKTAASSRELRMKSASPFFTVRNLMMIGSSHSLVKNFHMAEEYLQQGLGMAIEYNYLLYEAALRMHLAFLFLNMGFKEKAANEVGNGLRLMRENGYTYFISWSQKIFRPVLQFAVNKDIESDYAVFLARKRLKQCLKLNQSPADLLTISLFGGMTMKIAGKTICTADDLTPAWRQIISLILLSDNQSITNQALQDALWQKKSKVKARSSLDTQLSRLKKFLNKACSPHLLESYLISSKGVISFCNCSVDVLDFIEYAEKGLFHAERGHWWQAGKCFHKAVKIFESGKYDAHLGGSEEALVFGQKLKKLFVKIIVVWSGHMKDADQKIMALELLEKGFLCDPYDMYIVKALYLCLIDNKDIYRADHIMEQFSRLLKTKEYDVEMIKDIKKTIFQARQGVLSATEWYGAR